LTKRNEGLQKYECTVGSGSHSASSSTCTSTFFSSLAPASSSSSGSTNSSSGSQIGTASGGGRGGSALYIVNRGRKGRKESLDVSVELKHYHKVENTFVAHADAFASVPTLP